MAWWSYLSTITSLECSPKPCPLGWVFQATQLTHMTAMTGQQSIGESGNFYFELLIKASLNIRPTTNNNTVQTLIF